MGNWVQDRVPDPYTHASIVSTGNEHDFMEKTHEGVVQDEIDISQLSVEFSGDSVSVNDSFSMFANRDRKKRLNMDLEFYGVANGYFAVVQAVRNSKLVFEGGHEVVAEDVSNIYSYVSDVNTEALQYALSDIILFTENNYFSSSH